MAATPPRVSLAAVALLLTLAPCLCAATVAAPFGGDGAAGTPRKLGQDFLMTAMSEALQGATRHLTAVSSDTCPAGYVTVKRETTVTPGVNQVQWSTLRSLGWDVSTTRQPETTSTDFYSVNCNGFGNVNADRVSCTSSAPGVPIGETHVRHACTPSKELWVLAYTYPDYTFSTDVSSMWSLYNCPGTCGGGPNGNGGTKFLQYAGSITSGSCGGQSGCTSTCSGTDCTWCCADMWPVLDGSTWVGYLGKASFSLVPGDTISSSLFMSHLDFSVPPDTGKKTGSTLQGGSAGICMNCSIGTDPAPTIYDCNAFSLAQCGPGGYLIIPAPGGFLSPPVADDCCRYNCTGFTCNSTNNTAVTPTPADLTSPVDSSVCCRAYNCSSDWTCNDSPPLSNPPALTGRPSDALCCQTVYNCSSFGEAQCGTGGYLITPAPGGFLSPPVASQCCRYNCTGFTCNSANSTAVTPVPTNLTSPVDSSVCCRAYNCSSDWTCNNSPPLSNPPALTGRPSDALCCQAVYNCSSFGVAQCGTGGYLITPAPGGFLSPPVASQCCRYNCTGFTCNSANSTAVTPVPTNLTSPVDSSVCCRAYNCSSDWTCNNSPPLSNPPALTGRPSDALCCQTVYNCSSFGVAQCGTGGYLITPAPGGFLSPPVASQCCRYNCTGFTCNSANSTAVTPVPTNLTSPVDSSVCCRAYNCSSDWTCNNSPPLSNPPALTGRPSDALCCQTVYNCSSFGVAQCGTGGYLITPAPGGFLSPPVASQCCRYNCTGFTCNSANSTAVTPVPTNLTSPVDSSVCCRAYNCSSDWTCNNSPPLSNPPALTGRPSDALCCQTVYNCSSFGVAQCGTGGYLITPAPGGFLSPPVASQCCRYNCTGFTCNSANSTAVTPVPTNLTSPVDSSVCCRAYNCSSDWTCNNSPPLSNPPALTGRPSDALCCQTVYNCSSFGVAQCGTGGYLITPAPGGFLSPPVASQCCRYNCTGFTCNSANSTAVTPVPTNLTSPVDSSVCCRAYNCSSDWTCNNSPPLSNPPALTGRPSDALCCQTVYNCSSFGVAQCGTGGYLITPAPGGFLSPPVARDCCRYNCTGFTCNPPFVPVKPPPTNATSTLQCCEPKIDPIPPTCNCTCPIPSTALTAFNAAVRTAVTGTVQKGGPFWGIYQTSFATCSPASRLCTGSTSNPIKAGVYQNGYGLVSPSTSISPPTNTAGTKSWAAYSSYASVSSMRCPGSPTTPLKPNINSTSLAMVNYLINTFLNPSAGVNPKCVLPVGTQAGYYGSKTATAAGAYGPATSNDMQAAIFALTGQNRYAGPSNDAVVSCMLWNTVGKVPAGWVPPCNGTIAVILLPCKSDTCNDLAVQPIITQVPVTCNCPSCDPSCPAPGPLPPPPPTATAIASGWYYKSSTNSCPSQGCTPGGTKQCSTSLLCSPTILAANTSPMPCCNTCGSLNLPTPVGLPAGQALWQCRIPGASATYTWNLLVGSQFVGTCTVTVTTTTVKISSCAISDSSWLATAANFYISSTTAPTTCVASNWPAPAGRVFTISPPQTGTLSSVTTTFTPRPSSTSNTFIGMQFSLAKYN